MRKLLPVLALLLCSTPAFAWNCPSGQIRQQAPPGTSTTAPFYDVVQGIAFICVPTNPPTPPVTPPTVNQSQGQNATAQGGSSTSTSNSQGGNATGGSVSGSGNSQSTVKNSGNSSNMNSNSAQGGQGGSASSSNNSTGNVTSFSNVENQVRQTPMAYAPDAAFTTSPCVKGFSGGVSLPGGAGSFGASKTDKGCDSRQTAVVFHGLGNDLAAAKILCSTDAAKRAQLTLADCQSIMAPPQPQIVVREAPQALPTPVPQIIIMPAPLPVPVAVASDCKKPAPSAHYTRVCKESVKVATVGFCKLNGGLLNSGCYVVLDEAVGLVGTNNNARIVLTGPVESGRVILYLKQHKISLNRVTIRLADDQSGTLTVQTEIGE